MTFGVFRFLKKLKNLGFFKSDFYSPDPNFLSKQYVVCCLQIACSSWLKTLARAAGVKKIDHMFVHTNKLDKFVRPFAIFQPEKRKEIMRNHFKFMFVRHPFERLISAYKDKILSPRYTYLHTYIHTGRAKKK